MTAPLIVHRDCWARADAPGSATLAAALAALTPGQRLRLGTAPPAQPAREAAQEGQGDGDAAAPAATPSLADYSSAAVRNATLRGSADLGEREFEISFSSEEPYERWWGIEVLGHKSTEVDLGWLASGRAPFLCSHDTDEQIGVISRAWLKDRRGRAVVRFGKSPQAELQMQDARDGVRVNVSVGYEIRELELIKKDGDVSTYRVTEWRPLESSLVSIPADMTVGLGRTASAQTPESAPAPTLPAQPRQEQTMTQATQAAKEPLQGDEAFRTNAATIGRLAKTYGQWLKAGDESEAIATGADTQKFNDLIMARMTTGATDAGTLAGVGVTKKEARQYSFLRAIQAQIPGLNVDAGFERDVSTEIARMMGREAEGILIPADIMFAGLHGRSAREKRDFTVAAPTEAGNLVQTSVAADMWTDVLRPAMVLMQLGVTVLPGLRGNIAVPRKTVAGTLAALTEIAVATETQPTTALPVLSPKRISAFVDPSKQSIIQSEIGIEAMLRQDLVDGAAVLIENQGINGNGTAPNARGIRNVSGIGSVVGGANGLALAWGHITGLEAACANVNAGMTTRAGYLVNTKAVNTSKNVQKAANLPFIWDTGDRPLNGYRAGVSNNVPSNLTKGVSAGVCSSLLFSSDWSMFVMGLFGGLDVTVDPYSLATTGQVRITLNQFFDFLCRQPGAFASMDDALTP
jgi:HK97 family phage major capsid protein